jgi:type VI secretion system protein ImpG
VRDELLDYYESELSFLRQMGADFAEKYPKVASRLVLGPNVSEDPHVERLIESFAFLAARLHLKVDDDFPEITESLLSVLYPHYIRPIPSMSVVEFAVDAAQGKLTTVLNFPRHSVLYSVKDVEGVKCKFRTCYDTAVVPVRVSQAKWRAPEQLKPAIKAPTAATACALELTCFPDAFFKPLALQSLRFFLNGEDSLVHTIYELLLNSCFRIVLRNPDDLENRLIELPPDSLRPVGFADDEAVLPFPRRSFTGYRIMQEYFAFPKKFFFLELKNLDALQDKLFAHNPDRKGSDGKPLPNRAEIIFLIKSFERADRQQSLELNVSDKTFRLGCVPIINLFPQTAEPILVEQTRFDHHVVPDSRRRHGVEIFSIDEVSSSNLERSEVTVFQPFYSSHHGRASKTQAFWHASRRASTREDDAGTEMFLSLVDSSGNSAVSIAEAVMVRCTCTNRDLPSRLQIGSESGDFDLESGAAVKRIIALTKPTETMRIPSRKGLQWRLISHLSLNYLSLVEEGRGALQDVLRLYNFTEATALEKQISGITAVGSRRDVARVASQYGIHFARGIRVEIEFDEELYTGSGIFLFASILEYFLGLYTSLNSFSKLVVRSKQRKEILREWKPRAGQKILL